MTVQHVNMFETCLYYNRIKSLAFGGDLDAYMWQAQIGPQKPPLDGPMSSQTTSNSRECQCEHGWSMIGHK